MSCERLQKGSLILLIAVACARETAAPPASETTGPAAKIAAPPAAAPAASRPSYEDAMTWFRATPGFHFVIAEGGVRAEGDMIRERVGAERVEVTVNGEQWSAATTATGVTWRRGGRTAPTPEWGNRLFQRVTVAFDPQKVEGGAQLIGDHYRFIDANSGAIHDVWVNDAGQIERTTISSGFTMTLSRQR